jgi:hypothetical protein
MKMESTKAGKASRRPDTLEILKPLVAEEENRILPLMPECPLPTVLRHKGVHAY